MTVEQRLNGLETAVRRQRIIIAGMILLMVGLVTIAAAPQSENVDFNQVTAGSLYIEDDAGFSQMVLGTVEDGGILALFNKAGKQQIGLKADETGDYLSIYNKTGEGVVQLRADEYGNGLVGAYNRKGKGRTLEPGPR